MAGPANIPSTSKPAATVVGAGIIGVCAALFLQRAGFEVTLVDREGPGEGCSKGNCGGIATTEFMPINKPGNLTRIPGWMLDPQGPLSVSWRHLPRLLPYFARFLAAGRPSRLREVIAACAPLSRAVWDDYGLLLRESGLQDEIINDFCVTLYDSDRDLAADQGKWDACDALGFGYSKLTGAEVTEMEPDIAGDFAWGFVNENWRNLKDPQRLVIRWAEQLRRQGGKLLLADVAGVTREGTRVTALELAGGERLAVDRLVVAAGAWSHLITRHFGYRPPLESDRGYNTTIADPGVNPGRQIVYPAQGLAITPMEKGLRIGGSVELAGLEAPANWRRCEAQVTRAKRVFPALKTGQTERWMGHRPCLPDSLPVIGPAPGLANTFLAFGHGHLGVTWAPTTGRLIAEAMCGEPSIDLTPYRADRF